MKELPILFTGPNVRAILEGRKTQTRRVVKPPRGWETQYPRADPFAMPPAVWWWNGVHEHVGVKQDCPYGQPGDRLWVRETWAQTDGRHERVPVAYRATDEGRALLDDRWRPSIYMPRWASRITLEVIAVRVERLQAISQSDAISEGVERLGGATTCSPWRNYRIGKPGEMKMHCSAPARSFMTLWESINGPGSWDANPWVWVIEFKKEQP